MTTFDAIGLAGVAAYVTAYALLQFGKVAATDRSYLALNALGSVLILVSLRASFNLPSFVSQALWLLFTIAGAIRAHAMRARGA